MLSQFIESSASSGANGNDRAFKLLRQGAYVDVRPGGLGGINQTQRDDCRKTKFKDFGRQEQIAREVCRINNDDNHVRFFACLTANALSGDFFVQASRLQAVQTWKVDQFDVFCRGLICIAWLPAFGLPTSNTVGAVGGASVAADILTGLLQH